MGINTVSTTLTAEILISPNRVFFDHMWKLAHRCRGGCMWLGGLSLQACDQIIIIVSPALAEESHVYRPLSKSGREFLPQ